MRISDFQLMCDSYDSKSHVESWNILYKFTNDLFLDF